MKAMTVNGIGRLVGASSNTAAWGTSGRAAVQSGAFTIALGAAYRFIRIWLDSGSSTVRINWKAAADDTMAKRDDSQETLFAFDQDGQSTVYCYGDGAVGYLNYEAWN